MGFSVVSRRTCRESRSSDFHFLTAPVRLLGRGCEAPGFARSESRALREAEGSQGSLPNVAAASAPLHPHLRGSPSPRYGQSPYKDSGFQRVGLKQNLDFKGWNSFVHRGFPIHFDSTNLSRDNLSREIGRTGRLCVPSSHSADRKPGPGGGAEGAPRQPQYTRSGYGIGTRLDTTSIQFLMTYSMFTIRIRIIFEYLF